MKERNKWAKDKLIRKGDKFERKRENSETGKGRKNAKKRKQVK